MRNFFEIGRDRNSTLNTGNQLLLHSASQQAQNDDYMMNGRPSSSLGKDVSMGFALSGDELNRMTNTSMRWQSNNMMPQNVRMSKTRGWISEPQTTIMDSMQSRGISQVN